MSRRRPYLKTLCLMMFIWQYLGMGKYLSWQTPSGWQNDTQLKSFVNTFELPSALQINNWTRKALVFSLVQEALSVPGAALTA